MSVAHIASCGQGAPEVVSQNRSLSHRCSERRRQSVNVVLVVVKVDRDAKVPIPSRDDDSPLGQHADDSR